MVRIGACLAILALVLLLPGCRLGQGPDSVFNSASYAEATRAGCATYCHNASNPPNPLDPDAIGEHRMHVIEEKIACGACHYQYKERMTHFDGIQQTAGIVFFDSLNPTGAFDNARGRCSNLDCHGTETWN